MNTFVLVKSESKLRYAWTQILIYKCTQNFLLQKIQLFKERVSIPTMLNPIKEKILQ